MTLDIPREEWAEASGSYVEDNSGRLWRIIGFIDSPTVILDPVNICNHDSIEPERVRQYLVMGSRNADEFHRLRRDRGS